MVAADHGDKCKRTALDDAVSEDHAGCHSVASFPGYIDSPSGIFVGDPIHRGVRDGHLGAMSFLVACNQQSLPVRNRIRGFRFGVRALRTYGDRRLRTD